MRTVSKGLTPKEKKILQFIKRYIRRHDYAPTLAEMQDHFEYKSINSIQQFIRSLSEKGFIQYDHGSNLKRNISLPEAKNTDSIVTLKFEGEVAAGYMTEAVNQSEEIDVPYHMLNPSYEHFALRVKGDSMKNDHILNGDVIVIRRTTQFSNGQIVVAYAEEEATLKRIYKKKSHIELRPSNPDFDTIVIKDKNDFRVLGTLSLVMRQMNF